jgi:membrane-associated protein
LRPFSIMDSIKNLIHLLTTPDGMQYLTLTYGWLVYVLLFLIIFTETGLVVMPILPGDSLLFAVGAVCAITGNTGISIFIVIPLLVIAALCGDNVNYFIGKFFGLKIKERQRLLFLKREYIIKTEAFYARHGGKAIILARFAPIIRTIAPFVAGAGSMKYKRYILFCIAGAFLWVSIVTLCGYVFGQNVWVQKHIEMVILAIIGVSLLPVFYQFISMRFSKQV